MTLKFNEIEVSRLMFNGVEQLSLNYNGRGYFGKRFTLNQNSSSGVSFSIRRNNSPNQNAEIGSIYNGSPVFYGDEISISISPIAGYTNSILFVDIGDGNGLMQRTSPYTFKVTGNVFFKGSATETNPWQTLWKGTNTFYGSGSFAVQGLQSGEDVQISAVANFENYFVDENEEYYPGESNSVSIERRTLPITLQGSMATIDLSASGNQILFTFNMGRDVAKGFYIYEVPSSLTITEVRREHENICNHTGT